MNSYIKTITNKFLNNGKIDVDIDNKLYNLKEVVKLIEESRIDDLRGIFTPINPYDKCDILNQVKDIEFDNIILQILDIIEPEVIIKLSDNKKNILIRKIGIEGIADILLKLDNDEIIEFITDLEEDVIKKIIFNFPRFQRKSIKLALTYTSAQVGRVMETDFISVPKNSDVNYVIAQFRLNNDEISEHTRDIFVTDDDGFLIGTVSIFKIIGAEPDSPILSILNDDFKTINDASDVSEIVYMFDKYDLTTLSVLNTEGQMIGFISSDIARNITIEETKEDILRLSGVVEDDDDHRILKKSYIRSLWLFVNILACFISANVIRNFESVIAKHAFLAALIPIVASMGGNSGMQTVSLTIRMIAMKALNDVNKYIIMLREVLISLINALFFFIISYIISYFVYNSYTISLLFSTAVSINILLSALLGFFIPLFMKKIGTDPAITSTIFLTTITDFIGFSLFLYLVKLFF